MVEVTCPLCKEYSGAPRSVEAHVSSKTDEAHKGRTGRGVRDRLAPVEETDDAPDGGPDVEVAEVDGPSDYADQYKSSDCGGSGATSGASGGSFTLALGIAAGGYLLYKSLDSSSPADTGGSEESSDDGSDGEGEETTAPDETTEGTASTSSQPALIQ